MRLTSVADLRTNLREVLTREAGGRGFAGVTVIRHPGDEPCSVWVPDVSDEPVFLAYSITKTFTATLILQLCDQDALDLDQPVARWFPHLVEADSISVRQLLHHNAGIPDYGPLPSYHDGVRSSPSQPWTFDRFAAETFENGLLFPPGQGWAYSNAGYMLANAIAEDMTGLSFRNLIAERISRPLGLARLFVPESLGDLPPLAPGTSTLLSPDGSPRDVRRYYHPGWVSHGVVASPPSDLARFLDALFRGKLVSRQSLDHMLDLRPVSPGEDSGASEHDFPLRPRVPSYGLGLMGDPGSPWGLLAGHNGGGPCYSASAFHAFELHGATVCAMGAIEEGFSAERVVASTLDVIRATHAPPA